ncbi:MAG: hypothetical protein RTV31_04505 [Candidatus Thorarchaeota archaeon]
MKKKIKNDDESAAEQIWLIRDSIQKLEDLKDEIVTFLSNHLELKNSENNIWIDDAKGAYFNIVAAWQMLNSCTRQKPEVQAEKAESSLGFLKIAKSHLGQSASELRALKDKEASRLGKLWKETFEKCYQSISEQLERFLEVDEGEPPAETIVKVREGAYTLSCAVCGKVAVVILLNEDKFVYSGIMIETYIDKGLAKEVFRLLDMKNLKGLHSYYKRTIQLEEGMDAYCPECDSIYCSEHYATEEEWDEGFYDCTYGTCPQGHRRIIHD